MTPIPTNCVHCGAKIRSFRSRPIAGGHEIECKKCGKWTPYTPDTTGKDIVTTANGQAKGRTR